MFVNHVNLKSFIIILFFVFIISGINSHFINKETIIDESKVADKVTDKNNLDIPTSSIKYIDNKDSEYTTSDISLIASTEFLFSDTIVTSIINNNETETSESSTTKEDTNTDTEKIPFKDTPNKTTGINEEITNDNNQKTDYNEHNFPLQYKDESLSITVNKEWYEHTWCYIADIKCDVSRFNSCIAAGGYESTELCSNIIDRINPILLVNGDYYLPNYAENMYLIRNKNIIKSGVSDGYGIALMDTGSLEVIPAGVNSDDLISSGVIHTFMFGPVLVSENTNIASDIVQAPHTAIGMIAPGEYCIIVNNGRLSDGESYGLTLKELGELFLSKGCIFAYNLDGGGGSEMIFQGKILNSLSDGVERPAMDFIFFK